MLGMGRLKAAFCDDDGLFREDMMKAAAGAFLACGVETDCVPAGGGEELLALAERERPDLIFLDIDMPGMDGIRLGEELRRRGCGADIIYVSNMEDKVYEIFGVHPWSFMRKSRFSEELPGVVAQYVRDLRSRGRGFVTEDVEGRTYSFSPEELVYAEAAGKTQKLFTTLRPEPVILRSSMQALDGLLQGMGFIRVHKGFTVNYRYIRKITSRGVLLDDGRDIPVGRDRLAEARERYLSLMKWKGLGG